MKNLYLILLALVFVALSCQKDEIQIQETPASSFSNGVPLIWNQMYLDVERYTPGYRPPVSARNVAYINLSAYEAIVHGSNGVYKSFSGYYPGLSIDPPDARLEYNWEACLNAAYEKAFELYLPTAPAEKQFKMLEVSNDLRSKLQVKVEPEIYERSVIYGQYVANTIYEWSAQDSWGHEAYLKNNDQQYVPPQGDYLWAPTYPDYSPALLPHWGKVRTFAALDIDVVPPPHAHSTDPSSQMFNEAKEVYELVNEVKAGNKEEEYWIAQFWSDDCPILTFTPAGRFISITNQLVANERVNMLESVVLYAKVSMALSDAGVKCWQEKFKYNLMRPIDYIRKYMNAPNWNTVMCPDGSGSFYTPPFPAYPSGHATFGAAAAFVLEDKFGSNYRFTDRSHEGRTEFRSQPRTFDSFRDIAFENGYSRVPIGVHFWQDSKVGIDLGYIIGARVTTLPWK